MHMADALVSPAVGGAMYAVSAAALAVSAVRVGRDGLGERKIPVMAVTGAFAFAAQMINFTIPGTGSSGHIGGGILLAAMLGGAPALLTLASVLVIQCLFFADGGLLALGCNLFNMGVIPCLIAWPLVFRPLLRARRSPGRIMAASVLASVAALQLGAFGVVLETTLSGVTALPFRTFALLMQPIHLAIGAAEGVVTGGILICVNAARPELLESSLAGSPLPRGASLKKVLLVLGLAAALTAGGLSLLASARPDGLEWAVGKTAGTPALSASDAAHEKAAAVQKSTAAMPDYQTADGGGSSAAGLVGGALTFVLAGGAGFAVSRVKKAKKKTAGET